MYTYQAYGLHISAELDLPELIPAKHTLPDVVVRLGAITPPAAIEDGPASFHFEPGAAYLRWAFIGTFLVRDGREIVVDPQPGVDSGLLRLPLIGTVLGVLLHQRGRLTLHASAVALEDEAVLFVGPKGYGKSTTAAAFLREGCTLLTDDIAAIELTSGGCATLLPGACKLKLWPDALAKTVGDPQHFTRLTTDLEKRWVPIADTGLLQPLPIRTVYVLDWGQEAVIEPISPQEQLLALIANTYAAFLGRRMLPGDLARQHFEQCAALTRASGIHRLRRPADLERLPEVVATVTAGYRNIPV